MAYLRLRQAMLEPAAKRSVSGCDHQSVDLLSPAISIPDIAVWSRNSGEVRYAVTAGATLRTAKVDDMA